MDAPTLTRRRLLRLLNLPLVTYEDATLYLTPAPTGKEQEASGRNGYSLTGRLAEGVDNKRCPDCDILLFLIVQDAVMICSKVMHANPHLKPET